MYSFFMFGTSNFQDMLPVLFEHLSQDDDCWVSFFDCFSKKRQLHGYDINEIQKFFSEKCQQYNFKKPIITFYRHDDRDQYLKDYKEYRPTVVYVQEINPKYPVWYPKILNDAKIIHFAWWDEVKHLKDPQVKPRVSILKQKDDVKYGYDKYPHTYLGNLRMDHLKYAVRKKDNVKRCFIPETYLRMGQKDKNDSLKIAKFCDNLIEFLHKNSFEIIWKKREKGYPREKWCSPLDLMKHKPDVIIDRDLRFPSSLCEHAYISDCCIVINDSFAFFDIMHMNTNCIILTTEGGRKHKIDDFFREDFSENIIDMKNEDGWEKLQIEIEKQNKFEYNSKQQDNVSNKIIEYVKSL
tara:strand:+ start:44655 stop:45710 length:1056 start_codon:yes stop_codon:yes gene_type:complete